MNLRVPALSLFIVLLAAPAFAAEPEIPNPLIDAKAFLRDISESHQLREKRRVTEEQFLTMAKDRNTIVLDARSADRFTQLHIAGAKSLSFTDFTEEALQSVIPSKNTRILIYCNNNVAGSPIAFASKAPAASLNLSTYTALHSYGYKNVYELGPVIDPAVSKIAFEGTLAH